MTKKQDIKILTASAHDVTPLSVYPHRCSSQVEMLQRQSNALAGRVADLSEQLSDKNALADALQAERTRLEQELTQEARRRYTVPPASAGNGNENRGSVATTSPEGFTELAAEPDSNASSANNGDIANSAQPAAAAGDHHDSDRSAAQARAAAVATATAAAAVARISAAEARADAAVLKAEAGTSALSEMVDGLVSEKVQWEEERCAHAAETIRLRARARGLEEALAGNGLVVTEEEREWTVGRGESRLEALRELLRVRTRDLEAERGVSERLGERFCGVFRLWWGTWSVFRQRASRVFDVFLFRAWLTD